jgi:Translation initiation factor IF-3, N-terminal domain
MSGIRINEAITAPFMSLIEPDGSRWREVTLDFARTRARDLKLDLVEINAHSNPPTCKIMEAAPWIAQTERGKQERIRYDRRWRLAARVIEAARVVSKGQAPVGKAEEWEWLRGALAAWDAFNTAPPDPPPAAAKVAVGGKP